MRLRSRIWGRLQGLVLSACLTLGAPHTVGAAEKRDLSGSSPVLTQLQQMTTGVQALQVDQLTAVASQALGLEADSSLKLERTNKLPNGQDIHRYEQTFRGIPVWGERILVIRGANGSVQKLGGTAVYGVAPALVGAMPAMTPEQAVEKARRAANELKGNELKAIRDTNVRQVVYVTDSGTAHSAYEVSFAAVTRGAKERPARPFVILDARDGLVLLAWDGLAEDQQGSGPGGNQKTGRYDYGQGSYPLLEITIEGARCSLKAPNVLTEDMQNKQDGAGKAFEFPCFQNNAREANGAFSALNDAHFFATKIFEMYNAWYGLPPLTFPLHMRVHLGSGLANAYWNGQQMSFGDGNNDMYPLVIADIAAHEVAHGFTEQNSGLIYLLESGGINESFSDMAGEAFEYFLEQTSTSSEKKLPDYLTGANVFKAPNRALRYLCEPEKDGRSIGNVKDYRVGMDVHHSSGIFNKVFCLVARMPEWNPKKAFDVFFLANRTLWTPTSTFRNAAIQSVEAAAALGYDATAVAAAFKEVGIDVAVNTSLLPGCEDKDCPSESQTGGVSVAPQDDADRGCGDAEECAPGATPPGTSKDRARRSRIHQ